MRTPPRSTLFPYTTLFRSSITVREVRFRVEQPGFRTRSVVVVTTLLDPEQASKQELASLYRARWNNEVNHPDYHSSDKLGWSRRPPCPGCIRFATTRPVASWLSPRYARGPDMPAPQRRPAP